MKNTRIRDGAIMKQPSQNGDRTYVPDNSVGASKIQDNAIDYTKLSTLLQTLLFQDNLIDNAEGFLFQRTAPGTPTNIANDAFGPDRWNILCSTNNVAISQSTDAPAGARHAIKLDKATSDGFFGMMQMKEANESIALRNKVLNFAGAIKTESAEVSQVRISILGWTGTADAITSSIVSAWSSTPTLIANVVSYGTVTLDLSNSYQEFSISATVGGTCNNLIFFIHTTNSETVGDSILISAMRSYANAGAVPYVRRKDPDEIIRCQRFYEKTYMLDIPPGTATFTGAVSANHPGGVGVEGNYYFRVTKRTNASPVYYSPQTGASGNFRDTTSGVDRATTTLRTGQNNIAFSTSGVPAGSPDVAGQIVADVEL